MCSCSFGENAIASRPLTPDEAERVAQVIADVRRAAPAAPTAPELNASFRLPIAGQGNATIASEILREVAQMRKDGTAETTSLCWSPLELELLAMFAIDAKNKLAAPPAPDEVARLKVIIERERSAAMHWLNKVRQEIRGRRHLAEGRGSYEWDDDKYRKEFGWALEAIEGQIDKAEKKTNARSLIDCPTDQTSVDAARAELGAAPTATTPPSDLRWANTERGFAVASFEDRYGEACSLQRSSLAFEDCVWLGAAKSRMHLTRAMVAQLLPALQQFAQDGTLPPETRAASRESLSGTPKGGDNG